MGRVALCNPPKAHWIREREASIPPSALWRGRSKRFAFVAESSPTLFLFPDGFISFEPTVGPKRSVTVKAKYFYGTPSLLYPSYILSPSFLNPYSIRTRAGG